MHAFVVTPHTDGLPADDVLELELANADLLVGRESFKGDAPVVPPQVAEVRGLGLLLPHLRLAS